MRVVLASSSPRRAAYLKLLGFSFRRVPPELDETRRKGETPKRYVRRLAVEKARAVAERHPRDWVVGADTTVVLDDTLLGKPRNAKEAKRMLRRLSGKAHRVVSGIALTHVEKDVLESATSTTRVFFRPLTEEEIDWYVKTGEPLDKAGAYGIQGKGGLFVTRIEGSFSNVAGFPLEKFYDLLRLTIGGQA